MALAKALPNAALVMCGALVMTACASSGPRGPSAQERKRIDSVLATAPGRAQPTVIVAQEVAFARDARELGQWTAFRAYAAPGAILHLRSGAVDAASWLAARSDPAQSVDWNSRAVWMSCDGRDAVSMGRYRDSGDNVGTYFTVWQREASGEWRFAYDLGANDDPQPVRGAEPDPDPRAIVVRNYVPIQGRVADCSAPALDAVAFDQPPHARSAASASRDGTLHWQWSHGEDGTRNFSVKYWKKGVWETVVDESYTTNSDKGPVR